MKPVTGRLLAASTLVAMLVLSMGCRQGSQTPPTERTTEKPSAPADTASLPDLTGIWTVVGHHLAGTSAMGGVEATAWHGRTVRLAANEAISAGTHCDAPHYVTHSVAKDGFLGSEYHLPPGALPPLAARERLTVLDVACRGVHWAAMGSRLIGIDADRALAPWDGVFFEVARDRDFRALGQEPFWRLEICKGKELRFTYDLGERVAVTPAPVPKIDSENAATVYHAVTEANTVRVVIEQTPCTDVMSGKPFEATVTVILNGQTYHGCGGALP